MHLPPSEPDVGWSYSGIGMETVGEMGNELIEGKTPKVDVALVSV